METVNTALMDPPLEADMTIPAKADRGARTPICRPIITNILTVVMSEVHRTRRLAVEKRSVSAGEKL